MSIVGKKFPNIEVKAMNEMGDDFIPSPAEASDSPQLIASQKELENNASGSQLDALVRRKIKNTKVLNKTNRL